MKYKYVLLIAAAGLLLLLWPSGRNGGETAAEESPLAEELSADPADMERRLTALLSRAAGVGRVEVMLSLESDAEYVYADEYVRSREERDAGDGGTAASAEESIQYMRVRGQNGAETPVVRTRLCPVYRGAVVVCDGAEDAGTRLRIMQAVYALTGLTSERVSVIKMK